jgi:tRNA(adenine34) deaminase
MRHDGRVLTRPGSSISDEELMRAALTEARKAMASHEVPIGAVIAVGDEIVAAGFNQPISTVDPTAHAEIRALRAAAQKVGNYRLTGATLCVTVEPCAMCVGAMVHARIARVVFGTRDPKTGACGSIVDLPAIAHWNHHGTFEGGLLAEECGALLRRFFAERRS